MKAFLRLSSFCLILFTASCTVQQSAQKARIDDEGVMDITLSTMTKDAIRLKGAILAVKGQEDERNTYEFLVQEVVKYGATFSSAEPKIGETVTLMTPLSVSFEKGQVLILDVLTPRFDQGSEPMRVRLGRP